MADFALFHNDTQVSKPHSTREAVIVEAFEMGAAYRGSPDFIGENTHETVGLFEGYEIKESGNG